MRRFRRKKRLASANFQRIPAQAAYGKPKDSGAWTAAVSVHALLNWASVAALARALKAIYDSKNELGRQHLTTQHAYFGLASVILIAFNIVGGVNIKLSSTAYAANVKAHRFFGYVAYGAVLANHASALAKGYITRDETMKTGLWVTLAVQAAFMAQSAAMRLGQLLNKGSSAKLKKSS